jgi:endonuclease/exonuclease/phosphatase family metal-dependent hydrolase
MSLYPFMNRLILFALLACGLSTTGCARESSPETLTLRVMSYNIHHGEGTDGVFDYERLAAIINDQQPDLVALQEVDRGTTRADGVDQAAELARLTGMHHAYGAAMSYAGGEYGEAILSRWPIIETENFVVEQHEGSEPRAMIIVKVRPVRGGEIAFAGTHLAHDSDADRIEQAWRMQMRLNDMPYDAIPVILAGDLNATPGSGPMRELIERGGFDDCFSADPRPTYPNVEPDRRIDWILTRPGPSRVFDITALKVIENEPASDHCAILAEIRLWYDIQR